MEWLLSSSVVTIFLQLFVSMECGSSTGRLYLTDDQKNSLCSLDVPNLDISFCHNINADIYNIPPSYTDLMENTCQAIAQKLNFSQGTCMQSKSKVCFGLYTYSVTDACAITQSKADIATLSLNMGSQWIFLMYGNTAGDDTLVSCPNGLKDFDATQ